MISAIIVALESACSDEFGHSEETPKFFRGFAGPGVKTPYAVVVDAGSVPQFASESQRIDLGIAQVSVFAASKASARSLGKLIVSSLDDASALPASGGTLLELRHSISRWQSQSATAPGSPVVFQRCIDFTYRIER